MAEFIVAIEIGSSKITGIAGQKLADGSLKVLSVVKEDATECIRKGIINNIVKTGQCLTDIINRLRKQLKHEISFVYVGVGGQSIKSVRNVIDREFPEPTVISKAIIDELSDENRAMDYPDQEILDVVAQEFKVDNQFQLDPVGLQTTRLEASYLNILWRKIFYNRLNTCFDKAGIAVAEFYLAPIALADSVLTDTEKRGGCVLVDLGADTTTVSVYSKGILRHLAVIPLGGNNITKDIASLTMEESDAEKMKLKYGCAYTENTDIDPSLNYPIDHERNVSSQKFIEIVEARLEEIVENVWYQVPAEFSEHPDRLLGGIVLTGGGSNMKNIEKPFRLFTHVNKVRVAKFVTQSVKSSNADINAKNGTMNTILGLLAKSDMNCAGQPITDTPTLFEGGDKAKGPTTTTTTAIHQTPRSTNSLQQGVIMTEAEKKKAEEERRKAEEEKRKAEEEEAKRKEEEECKRRNSFGYKFMRGIKKFGKDIFSPDDDEDTQQK